MQGVSKVYHCAAMVSLSNRERKHMYRVNIQGTANVVNLCLDLGVEKLVHISSVAGLGRERNGAFFSEKTALDRKRLVSGKSVAIRIDLGGSRIIYNQIPIKQLL